MRAGYLQRPAQRPAQRSDRTDSADAHQAFERSPLLTVRIMGSSSATSIRQPFANLSLFYGSWSLM
jgi:hypothetical protein